jgi:hypothetical protein
MYGLTSAEEKIFKKLSTPQKVQDYLDTLPFNFEEGGETLMSPRRVLKAGKAHCLEGAMLAAAAFLYHGRPPLLVDFKTVPTDEDHVVTLFKDGGLWGAVSKTNHGILRFRDPVYRTLRELAMSYFHEYYDFNNGQKTMTSYSKSINLNRFGHAWLTRETDWWELDKIIEREKHLPIAPKAAMKNLRRVGETEIKMGQVVEWRRCG